MNDHLKKELQTSKRLMTIMVATENKEMLVMIKVINKKICLATSNFKCQCCSSPDNLQLHHLIPKHAKQYVDYWRYASQRNYWANQIILCQKCHNRYHNYNEELFKQTTSTITQEFIDKVKREYCFENSNIDERGLRK